MKTIKLIFGLIIIAPLTANAQNAEQRVYQFELQREAQEAAYLNSLNAQAAAQAAAKRAAEAAAEAARQRQAFLDSLVPKDPWRAIDGQTNLVKLNGVQFCGKVMDITPDGIRIDGTWGDLGSVYYNPDNLDYRDFFVANFPYEVANDDILSPNEYLMAWYAGTYTYQTVNGGSRTIRKLDYGVPCAPDMAKVEAMQRQIDEAQKEAQEKQKELVSKQIERLAASATNGDSAAQYSLGIHYLHGIGCETNQDAAVFWLTKAAAQGNMDASNDVQEIDSKSASSVSVIAR